MRMKVSNEHTKVRVEMQDVDECIKVTVKLSKLIKERVSVSMQKVRVGMRVRVKKCFSVTSVASITCI
jgi:hypothetical protein